MLGFFTAQFKRFRTMRQITQRYPELRNLPQAPKSSEEHIHAAISWLLEAHKQTGQAGIASVYRLDTQVWGNAYRETTGYIIPSLLAYAERFNKPDVEAEALQMARWEVTEQQQDGAYGEPQPDGTLSKKVFNTGQVLLGLCVLARRTGDQTFQSAATRSGNWLLSHQRVDGTWDTYTTKGPRTYHAEVAWPLLELFCITNDERYLLAAEKQLTWVLAQQTKNGWYQTTSLSHPDKPWTHLIAYTIRGLLESSELLPKDHPLKAVCLNSAVRACEAIYTRYMEQRTSSFPYLPGTLDPEWRSVDRYSCLTGNAQIAIIWLKLARILQKPEWAIRADLLLQDVMSIQVMNSHHPELYGGVPGSFPIDGYYVSYGLINWSVKFLLDGLLLKSFPDLDLRA